MSKIRVKVGKTEIVASSELEEMTNQILTKTIPETKKTIELAIDKIYQEAFDEWPVSDKNRGFKELVFINAARLQKKGMDRKQAIAVSFEKLRMGELKKRVSSSREMRGHSRDKLERGFIIDTASSEIVGYIRNMAQYAWAIKVGVNSDSTLPLGANVSNELLWKPLRKESNRIVKTIADEIELNLKR